MIRSTLLAFPLALAATGAAAHSDCTATTPADGATVETVETLALRFEAPMRVTAIEATGPDGTVPVTRETGTEPVTEVTATPDAALAPGDYAVEWRGVSADGHPVQGSYAFTVAD